MEDVRKTVNNCRVCSEIKPRYYSPPAVSLVKATQPFERLSVDFKGPLPSSSKNHYFLTIVDEFSRFPFAFPCRSTDANTVIECLNQLFAVFGLCGYIHSDRGPAFMSNELISYLHSRGIACSKTSAYNPRGNGQCERYNGIIWSSVKLALKSRNLDISQWESVLPHALHSIRSLLCTATNETPHEKLFNFKCRSSSGVSVPTWLTSPGPVLLKRHVRNSKYDPAVEEVELLHATPNYAVVRLPSGNESTVSLKDVAPVGQAQENASEVRDSLLEERDFEAKPPTTSPEVVPVENRIVSEDTSIGDGSSLSQAATESTDQAAVELRRSTRVRKPVDRYGAVPY